MWLLDSDKPDFYNLTNYYKVELEKSIDNSKITLIRLLHNKLDSFNMVLREKSQYKAFREKVNTLLKMNGFLFIETNPSAYIWLNQNYIVKIASKLKDTMVNIEIETTSGYIDNVNIGSRLELQLFVAKNLSSLLAIPNKPLGKDTRGAKQKYDIKYSSI